MGEADNPEETEKNLPEGVDKDLKEIEVLRSRKNFYDRLRTGVPPFGFVLSFILFLIYYYTSYQYQFVLGLGLFYFAIAILYPAFDLGESISIEIEALESKISLGAKGSEAIEQRAERLFRSHEIGLRRFYDQALKQSNVIFIAGIICLVFGFCFMGYTFYYIIKAKPTTEQDLLFNEKILISSLGILSGVLTNFVAVLYIKMYERTIRSLTTFHDRLVTTNHLHFANFLVSKISDKKIFDDTLKELSLKIIHQK